MSSKKPTSPAAVQRKTLRAALAGNPNSGKSTLFNALTGLKQKTGNFPGVTVERKSATLNTPDGSTLELVDLPGLYSIIPQSLDEQISAEIILGSYTDEPELDVVVVVADATNLSRGLYLSMQIVDLGKPVILALTMMDLAAKLGIEINLAGLSRRLEIPVIPVVAKKNEGLKEIKNEICRLAENAATRQPALPSKDFVDTVEICQPMMNLLREAGVKTEAGAFAESLRIVSQEDIEKKWADLIGDGAFGSLVQKARLAFKERGIPAQQVEARIRYAAIDQIVAQNVHNKTIETNDAFSEKLDRVLTHRIWGPIIMFFLLSTIFQAIFTWASIPMDAIESGVGWIGAQVQLSMPAGVLTDLLVDGVIAGVGSVLVFLPQICFLIFFLSLLEDSGYLARIAFILDRFMARIGLSGQSIIPLLSSFACAIPGIMATRSIHNTKDRLITMLIAPFMSCSARLPVYTIMTGIFIPDIWIGNIFYLPVLVFLSMYFVGILAAVVSSIILHKWVIKGKSACFFMELPVYRAPVFKVVLYRVFEAGRAFVVDAGKIIFAMSIILWFLSTYPKTQSSTAPQAEQVASDVVPNSSDQLRNSYAGKLGQYIEPVIKPLGFDWKIGIGLITSFAAREVIISTLATIYNVQDADENTVSLRSAIKNDVYSETGKPVYSPLVAISLMVFFVLACQCMSTLAVIKRETNGWRWPVLTFSYMLVLAWLGSFSVYQGGLLLGLG